MTAEIITIYESNFRQPAATLRMIADEIEAGKFGEVGSLGVVLLGDTMEIFGSGTDCEAPSIALLFSAATLRFARTVEEHGK